MTAEEILIELVRRPSITPEDGGTIAWISELLAPLGFKTQRFDAGGTSNAVIMREGDLSLPSLAFAGHVDVVPPGAPEAWNSPPFEPEVRDARLYGRGTSDMKGSIAAFVAAVLRQPPVQTCAILLTSDEEGEGTYGSKYLCQQLSTQGLYWDYIVLGEPTATQQVGDALKIGRRGSLSVNLTIHGVQGHVAYPHLADNAANRLAQVLSEVVTRRWDDGNEFFPPTTVQITKVECDSGAGNVIPSVARAKFNFRFGSALTSQQLIQDLQAIFAPHRYDATFDVSREPFLTKKGRLVEAATESCQALLGLSPEYSTGGGASDAPYLAEIAGELIEFGPSNATIHMANENILLQELQATSELYGDLLKRLASPTPPG